MLKYNIYTKEKRGEVRVEEKSKSYNNTLNIPKTDFPLVTNLGEKEKFILERMELLQIYPKLVEKNKVNNKKYILHDGPSYANLDISLGHALNKILKDIIIRYKSMNGYYAPFIPGWDTHGLPLEKKVQEKYNLKKEETEDIKYRDMCRDYALECVEKQVSEFKRLGVIGDFNKRYVTLDPKIESRQIEVFGELYENGYLYRGLRPVNYCRECKVPVAENDLELYNDKVETIYVKFRVIEDKQNNLNLEDLENVYLVICTNKVWTLAGNQAILAKPNLKYVVVSDGFNKYIIAENSVENVLNLAGINKYEIINKIDGCKLENIIYTHPFVDRCGKVILKSSEKNNILENETGLLNIAPGLEFFDYNEYKIDQKDAILPLDDNLVFTEDAGIFSGYSYYEGSKKIQIFLKETGYLLAKKIDTCECKHCSRCKQPTIEKATTQWFVNLEKLKPRILHSIKNVKWIPKWGEEEIFNMIDKREDWCISRQRIWGCPIPVFYCEKCGHELINSNIIKNISNLIKENGSRIWYEKNVEEILNGHYLCSKCAHNKFIKETDTMDVWFDSGCTHETVLSQMDELSFPADMYLEGKDQFRGWFQASLITAIATKNEVPYKSVIAHGFVVDNNGKKLTKESNTNLTPQYIIDKYGADILRLWTVYGDYRTDVKISEEILKQITEVYNKIRAVSRFMLANLTDFVPERDYKILTYRSSLDRYALLKLNNLVEEVTKYYDKYDFHQVYLLLQKFYVDLSSDYLDCIKSNLYTLKQDSLIRRCIQSTLYDILITLTKLIAPILSFTAEEIWGYMQFRNIDNAESTLLSYWPKVNIRCQDTELEKSFIKINELKEKINKKIIEAQKERVIKSSLDAKVIYYATTEEEKNYILYNLDLLKSILIISQLEVLDGNKGIKVVKANGQKCARCLKYSQTVGMSREYLDICKECIDNIK